MISFRFNDFNRAESEEKSMHVGIYSQRMLNRNDLIYIPYFWNFSAVAILYRKEREKTEVYIIQDKRERLKNVICEKNEKNLQGIETFCLFKRVIVKEKETLEFFWWSKDTFEDQKELWRHIWKAKNESWHLFAIYYQFIFSIFSLLSRFNFWNETRKQTDERNSYLSIDSISCIFQERYSFNWFLAWVHAMAKEQEHTIKKNFCGNT